jgi:hypothetical protein
MEEVSGLIRVHGRDNWNMLIRPPVAHDTDGGTDGAIGISRMAIVCCEYWFQFASILEFLVGLTTLVCWPAAIDGINSFSG